MTQPPDPLAPWTGDVHAARELQTALAARVSLRDDFPRTLRAVAGCDVGFEDEGAITRAAVVLLDAETLQPLEQHVARLPTAMPEIPGLLSFRKLPALLEAFSRLSRTPDLVFVDGHGIAHPRRLGIAAHFGVATGLPSIGVTKNILIGTTSMPLHEMRGAFVPLRDGREQIGWVLRSKVGCLPLVVSPGHRVAMPSAAEVVMRFVRGYRLPEPTRLADRLASRRDR
jgi:deoxyribonuclease V